MSEQHNGSYHEIKPGEEIQLTGKTQASIAKPVMPKPVAAQSDTAVAPQKARGELVLRLVIEH